MAKKALPCPTLLRQLLRYEPETGKLFWKPRPKGNAQWNGRFAGKEAFTATDAYGYKVGAVNYQNVKAHRAAWAITYGYWPDDLIDHINRVPADNRLVNLRVSDKTRNAINSNLRADNSSGHCGVVSRYGKWSAFIRADGRQVWLGSYVDYADAVAARVRAERDLGFHENHGRVRTTQSI